MARLTGKPTHRVLRALKRAGWELRPGKPGSKHYVLIHATRRGIFCVPRHSQTRKAILAKIIKEAGLTLAAFQELYR